MDAGELAVRYVTVLLAGSRLEDVLNALDRENLMDPKKQHCPEVVSGPQLEIVASTVVSLTLEDRNM